MTIFGNISHEKLDSFIGLVQACNPAHRPSFTDKDNAILASNDTTLKATLCAQFLIGWQNNLNHCKTDPECKILFSARRYHAFNESQKALNKLKRKFSRLIIERMVPEVQERLAKEAVTKYRLKEPSTQFVDHLFRYHGDNTLCLEWISDHVNCPLSSSARSPVELITLLGESNNIQADPRFVLAVASTVEHFSLSANTWGYPGQESSPLSKFSSDKQNIVWKRLAYARDKNMLKLNPTSPWNRVVQKSGFERYIQLAKLLDGSLVENCGEKSIRLFHQVTKQRKFDYIMRVGIVPGDHFFVIAKDPTQPQFHILDGWNGAKIYLENEKEKHLFDFVPGDTVDGKPLLKKFDPAKQGVMVSVSSIYFSQAFKSASRTKHPHLLKLLAEFELIPKQNRTKKMLKALEIIQWIETKMPLYEYIDRPVLQLYDQMVYLTKKERKKGLTLPPQNDKDRCLVNEALHALDLASLHNHLKEDGKMDALTILHAIKASLRANDIRFLKEVVDANVPIEKNAFTMYFHHDPAKAILQLASELSAANGSLILTDYCAKAVRNQQTNSG